MRTGYPGDEGREAPAASTVGGRAQVHAAPGRQAEGQDQTLMTSRTGLRLGMRFYGPRKQACKTWELLQERRLEDLVQSISSVS